MSKVLIVFLGCLVASLGTLLVLLSFTPEERGDATGQTLSFNELTRQPVSSTFDSSNSNPPSQTSGQPLQWHARDGQRLTAFHFPSVASIKLILLHGSGYHGRYLHAMAAALADGGLADVMVPNLRGHYLSGLERGDIDYIDQLTDDLSDLIGILRRDAPRARILVGGHSSGGGLALRFAGSKDGHQVESYLLMAPFFGQSAPTTRRRVGGWAQPAYPRIIGLSVLNAVGIRSLNGLKTLAFNMPASARDGTETLVYSYRLMNGFAPHPELSSDLAALPNSSLLLVGLDDEAFLAYEYPPLLKKYSQANAVLLPNQTHFSIVRHPDALAEVVQWIQLLRPLLRGNLPPQN